MICKKEKLKLVSYITNIRLREYFIKKIGFSDYCKKMGYKCNFHALQKQREKDIKNLKIIKRNVKIIFTKGSY